MKKFLLLMILLGIFNVAHAEKISTELFLNDAIFDQFENEGVQVTLKEFSKTHCRLYIKNKLSTKFRPQAKIHFTDNWGMKKNETKILSEIDSGKTIFLDIFMKDYTVNRRKNTSAWLQIWLSGEKLVLEDNEISTWQKISPSEIKDFFSENYFCIKFNFLISDEEVEREF